MTIKTIQDKIDNKADMQLRRELVEAFSKLYAATKIGGYWKIKLPLSGGNTVELNASHLVNALEQKA